MPWLLICTLFIVFGIGCAKPRSEPDTETIMAFYEAHGEAEANAIRIKEGW